MTQDELQEWADKNVTVVDSSTFSDDLAGLALYVPTRYMIYLDEDLEGIEWHAVLQHELAHCILGHTEEDHKEGHELAAWQQVIEWCKEDEEHLEDTEVMEYAVQRINEND